MPTGTMSKDRLTRLVLDRKVAVEQLEDRPDHHEAGHDRQHAEVTAADPAQRAEELGPQPGVDRGVGRHGGGRAGGPRTSSSRAGSEVRTSWLIVPPRVVGLVGLVGLVGPRGGGPAGDDVVVGPGDGRDDLLGGDRADVEDAVVAAQAEDDHAVGDRAHVLHVVADHDHAEPAVAQPLDEVEHLGGLGDAEGGGRLVEDDDLRVTQQRAGDGDGLPLPARQRRDRDAARWGSSPTARAAAPTSAPPWPRRRGASGRSSWPRNRFSITLRFSQSARSWKTVAMPTAWASAGEPDMALDALEARWCPRRAGAPRRAP